MKFKTNPKKSALFLDRDGVLNRRLVGEYVCRPDEFEPMPGATEILQKIKKAGLFARVFVVTNQQGIGKGLMSEKDLEEIHQKMIGILGENLLDEIYFCPALRKENSPDRKPAIGMALAAARQFPEIDLSASLMIGDAPSDLLFGKNAGMKTVLFGELHEEITEKDRKNADFFCQDWPVVRALFF